MESNYGDTPESVEFVIDMYYVFLFMLALRVIMKTWRENRQRGEKTDNVVVDKEERISIITDIVYRRHYIAMKIIQWFSRIPVTLFRHSILMVIEVVTNLLEIGFYLCLIPFCSKFVRPSLFRLPQKIIILSFSL